MSRSTEHNVRSMSWITEILSQDHDRVRISDWVILRHGYWRRFPVTYHMGYYGSSHQIVRTVSELKLYSAFIRIRRFPKNMSDAPVKNVSEKREQLLLV